MYISAKQACESSSPSRVSNLTLLQKVRQSWNKYNLYNLSRITSPPYKTRSFFQQKWTAKSALRAYHGEQVRERQWERMFSRRLNAVVSMNAEYLASNDGRLESAGRGSGEETERPRRRPDPTPYMQMTFAPLERRLDNAVFRAMFASSARQARQFVIHGAVQVNGKKVRHLSSISSEVLIVSQMKYPGYLLNPGDMFQVDPERVMFATGAPKAPSEATMVSDEEETSGNEEIDPNEPREMTSESDQDDREPREVLRDLLAQAKSILASPREKIGAKKKQDLRAFSKSVKRMLSRSKSSTILTDSLEAQFLEIQNQLQIQREQKTSSISSLRSTQPNPAGKETERQDTTAQGLASSIPQERGDFTDTKHDSGASEIIDANPSVAFEEEAKNTITDREYNELFAALAEMQENPIDESKPYATPWMPRDYMSAFAFIPRYLEVNPSICAAVYLRHPVARPGLAEVPTPFAETTGGTAFAWYLRRR